MDQHHGTDAAIQGADDGWEIGSRCQDRGSRTRTAAETEPADDQEAYQGKRNGSSRGWQAHRRQTSMPSHGVNSAEWPRFAKVLAVGVARSGSTVMLGSMDWQKPAALSVVGITLGLFLWPKIARSKWVPRRWRNRWGHSASDCGCTGGSTPGAPGLIVRGRRGERPQVIFR